jgi:hypothetical protein
MEVFTAWLKDKVANKIDLPATIHRNGTHYTALVQVSGRLDASPSSSLAQVVGLFMACQGRAGSFFLNDNGVVRECHFSADTMTPFAGDGEQEVTLEFDIEN